MLCVIAVVAQWLIIAKYGSNGGTVYGPRLMLDIVPLLVFLAAAVLGSVFQEGTHGTSRLRRTTAVVLVASTASFGFFVNATGAVLRSSRCWNIVPVTVDDDPSRAWDWSDPQFVWPYKQVLRGGSLRDVMTPHCGEVAGRAAPPP
jgi:hypothetical protein